MRGWGPVAEVREKIKKEKAEGRPPSLATDRRGFTFSVFPQIQTRPLPKPAHNSCGTLIKVNCGHMPKFTKKAAPSPINNIRASECSVQRQFATVQAEPLVFIPRPEIPDLPFLQGLLSCALHKFRVNIGVSE